MTQPTISKDLRAIQAEWRKSAIRDFDLLRERELRKIDRLEREAWAAWERSQQPAQSAVITGEGAGQQTRKSLKNQVGDPRFLDLVGKCIIQRRTLLGIDAPLQVTDMTSSVIESPEERRARLEQPLQRIVAQADGPRRISVHDPVDS